MSNRLDIIRLIAIGCIAAIISGYFINSLTTLSSRPEVIFDVNQSKFGNFVLNQCDVVQEPFFPTWWAATPIMQTVLPAVLRSRWDKLNYTRELITCPDGGVVSLDWFEPSAEKEDDNSPVAVMFPGLIGDSQSDYLRYIVPSIRKLGYRVASFNNRGRNGMKLLTPKVYSATKSDDFELVINHIRDKNPHSLFVASGFSMGGIILARYLAEKGRDAKVDAAMLLSANYDAVNGARHMEKTVTNRLIAKLMTDSIVQNLLADREVLSQAKKNIQWDKLKQANSFRDVERYFTCPMWGYDDPDDFYRDASNAERISKIKVPTLALNSADDMFTPYEILPLTKLNEAIVFVVTRRGGHLGFMDGWAPTLPYYFDRLILKFHEVLLQVKNPRELVEADTT